MQSVISFNYLVHLCPECRKMQSSVVETDNLYENFLPGDIVIPLSLGWQSSETIDIHVDHPFLVIIKYHNHARDKSTPLSQLTLPNLSSSNNLYGYVPLFMMEIKMS